MSLIESAKAVLNENHTYGYASLETLNKLEQAVLARLPKPIGEPVGMKVTVKEIIDFCRLTFAGHPYGQAIANRIEAHGIEQPSIDALIDVLAETPFKKNLGDSEWKATFSDHQLDIINNAIRARGQK